MNAASFSAKLVNIWQTTWYTNPQNSSRYYHISLHDWFLNLLHQNGSSGRKVPKYNIPSVVFYKSLHNLNCSNRCFPSNFCSCRFEYFFT
jgi:hypothetical protein